MRLILQLLLLLLSAEGLSAEESTAKLQVLTPLNGAIVSGGVVHFNYTISGCEAGSYIAFHIDDTQIGGEGAHFYCQEYMWHGISTIPEGEHTAFFVLYHASGAPVLAHQEVNFEVREGHGRFFDTQELVLADGARSGAYFRSPRNNSVFVYNETGIELQLQALNFEPGTNGWAFHLTILGVEEELETRDFKVHLKFPPDSYCISVAAAVHGVDVTPPEVLCVRIVESQVPGTNCEAAKALLRSHHFRSGLVIDTPECDSSYRIADTCEYCREVLCSPWQKEMAKEEDVEPRWDATTQEYKDHFFSKLRRVHYMDVPYLEEESLDFLLFRHQRVESAVDQQKELEGILGACWGLVKPGGLIGVLHDEGQIIVLSDPDGNLFNAYADYPYTLRLTSEAQGTPGVNPVQCFSEEFGVKQSSVVLKPVPPVKPVEYSKRGFVETAMFKDEEGDLNEIDYSLLSEEDKEVVEPIRKLKFVDHIYIVHFEPLAERRAYLESVFHEKWGLTKDVVTFVTWCDSRYTSQETIDEYFQVTNECLRSRAWRGPEVVEDSIDPQKNLETILGFKLKKAQLCTAISHYDSLKDMIANGYETALVLEDDAVFDENFPALLEEYRKQLDPDWGVFFTDAATSCHWWLECPDLPKKRPTPSVFRRWVPRGAFGGAILWNQRGARALLSTFQPFCLPWDMEIEYHFKIHNISVHFASPSLIVQGSFLNPDEKGFTKSSLIGERAGPKKMASLGVTSGVPSS